MHAKRNQIILAIILSGFVFAALAFLRLLPAAHSLDVFAAREALLLRNPALTAFLATLTELFSIPVLLIVFAGMLAVLFFEPNKKPASFLLVSGLLSAALFAAAKLMIHSARPAGALIAASGFGFPSGHAAVATTFFIFLGFLFEHVSRSRGVRLLFNLLSACMIVAVSLSRVILGVHWLSDVLAGMALGVFSSAVARLYFDPTEKFSKPESISKIFKKSWKRAS
ncbi:MAG TPA: phosphatase PAP2 family protein [Candidatus Paceibacterota bacterium]|jgi:undecaprenyl-diphosphatase|nr:phosphatase PAP2 family protein [Candidatus Paceibacterota bacterium]